MEPINDEHEGGVEGGMRLFFYHLLSLGYGAVQAGATASVQACLIKAASKLARRRQAPPEDDEPLIAISPLNDNFEGALLHDDVLLPKWKRFAAALSSVPCRQNGYISLMFQQVQLDTAVSGMLLQSFKTAPLQTLTLKNNGLGSDGIQFVDNVLKSNDTLEILWIESNHIESEHDSITLVRAVIKHRKLDILVLRQCGLGQNNAVMRSLVPAILNLKQLWLDGNYIGSHGAKVIADCLATNPGTEVLSLTHNLLNDEDANMLASSLKTNTNLCILDIAGNRLTQVGINALTTAVADCSSLNSLYDSNHTCHLGDSEGMPANLNTSLNPTWNRKLKVLSAIRLPGKNLLYLDGVPIGIMPRVLAFLQGREFVYASKDKLSGVFQILREWSMPLLYTSRIGDELRRSERIRKKKIMQLMMGK